MSGKGCRIFKDVLCVGDGGEQLVKVALINTLRKEGNNTEVLSIGAKFEEHWGGK